MIVSTREVDAVVIGGGFYGAAIAIYLAKQRGLRRVVLLERETKLLGRASYHNQARVHNGYHYPRSFTTAFRSRVNLPKFVRDWPEAVKMDFIKLYAIARRNSKVTAKQFERFCNEIGAKIQPAEST
ncbi:MAG TPA: FAD-dependent oxidoreductase, partial [Pseudoduganella sp.]